MFPVEIPEIFSSFARSFFSRFLVLIKEFKLKLYLPIFIYIIKESLRFQDITLLFLKTTLKFNNARSVNFLSKCHPQQESSSFYGIEDRVKAIKSILLLHKENS